VTEAERTRADASARAHEAALAFGYPSSAADVLVAYVEAVLAEGEHVNLTGARSLDAALPVLALDSMPVVSAAGGRPRLVVDVGSGNGLPGVAAALAWPEATVLLVERRGKKAAAIGRCLAATGIANALPVPCDSRELSRARPDVPGRVDLVTARAVSSLDAVLRDAVPWLAPGGRCLHWKPAAVDPAERAAADDVARAAGLRPLPDHPFEVPGLASARCVVRHERPRGTGGAS
jgi:16S rRNA (guanine527-N7)-methyltransferase